jgi:hypothetical protein
VSRENPVQRAGWLRAARHAVLWRLNTGKAWLSGLGPRGVHWAPDRSHVRIDAARPIAVGLGMVNGDPVVGAGDLLGRLSIVITPEMVGQTVAVFCSLEAKRTTGGRVSEEQSNWGEQTTNAGGIYGVFRSEEEAERIILDWCEKRGAKLP